MDWNRADPAEVDGLIVRLCACRRDAQRELQAAEQEAVAHPECARWAEQAQAARALVRDCTTEIDCLQTEQQLRAIPAQR